MPCITVILPVNVLWLHWGNINDFIHDIVIELLIKLQTITIHGASLCISIRNSPLIHWIYLPKEVRVRIQDGEWRGRKFTDTIYIAREQATSTKNATKIHVDYVF